jgi:hypothetical protein
VRSYFEVPLETTHGLASETRFMWLNITWNSGVWLELRSGLRARTISSNGTS